MLAGKELIDELVANWLGYGIENPEDLRVANRIFRKYMKDPKARNQLRRILSKHLGKPLSRLTTKEMAHYNGLIMANALVRELKKVKGSA